MQQQDLQIKADNNHSTEEKQNERVPRETQTQLCSQSSQSSQSEPPPPATNQTQTTNEIFETSK
jgi:hypothetical protein